MVRDDLLKTKLKNTIFKMLILSMNELLKINNIKNIKFRRIYTKEYKLNKHNFMNQIKEIMKLPISLKYSRKKYSNLHSFEKLQKRKKFKQSSTLQSFFNKKLVSFAKELFLNEKHFPLLTKKLNNDEIIKGLKIFDEFIDNNKQKT